MRRTLMDQVSQALADATGRTEEEVKVVIAVGAVTTSIMAALRFLTFLADLGTDVLDRAWN